MRNYSQEYYQSTIEKLHIQEQYNEITKSEMYGMKEAEMIMLYQAHELQSMAIFYGISIFKKTTIQIIHSIIDFELNVENIRIVKERRKLWKYTYGTKNSIYNKYPSK